MWLGASGIAAFGGLVFLIFGDASVQAFDKIDTSQDKSDQESNQDKADSSKPDSINSPQAADNKAFAKGPDDPASEATFKESAQI